MERTIPRNVLLTGALVAILGLWFGLQATDTLASYGDCVTAHGVGDGWRVCELEVR